jgi:hypothetical protein
MAKYELWLTDDHGRRIADAQGKTILKSFLSLSATRAANEIGQFNLFLPPSFDESLLAPDRMVQVWRKPTGGQLGLWRVYFIRWWNPREEGSQEVIEVKGPDSNELLRRRVIAAYSGDVDYAAIGDNVEADLMIQQLVAASQEDTAAGPASASGTREWDDFSAPVAATSTAPTTYKTFELGDPLLTESGNGILPQIANDARTQGTEVFFDVVPVITSTGISFEFRTYLNHPGQDVSASVTFAKEFGNLKNASLEYDYTREENYIYAGGQGEKAARTVEQVYDVARYGASKWNRCEGFASATSEKTPDGVEAFGNTKLAEGRPRIRFSGIPMDTKGTRFGIHWNFGDKVTARYRSYQGTHIIRAVSLSVDGKGKETIGVRLDAESS